VGFGRRGAICFVAAPPRRADYSVRRGVAHLAPRRSERLASYFGDGTPAQTKSEADVILTHRDVDTGAGPVRLVFQGATLVGLHFLDHRDGLDKALLSRFGSFELEPADGDAAPALESFAAYLAGDLSALDRIAADPGGTPFQRRVWDRLREIPHGETWTYGELAESIGRPSAMRAVGAANGANPIAIVIPCHRVVAKGGSLWGYGGGLERKRWLLEHEGALTKPLV
jgi:methylated-DNA-[protein]-cysteine S-methyltransferase